MNPNRLLSQCLTVLLVGLVAVAVLQGCAGKPDEPSFDNPFDPDNAESANPFGLQAVEAQGLIILAWDMLDGFGFTSYIPQHRVEGVSDWTPLDTLDAVVGPAQYTFSDPVPTATNYFRVLGMDDNLFLTSSTTVVPVSVSVPPIVNNIDGTTTVSSRHQILVVAATAGDEVEVSRDSLFAVVDANAPRAEDGDTYFADYDLGEAASDSAVTVFARTVTDLGGGLPPIYSGRGSRTFDVGPAPTLSLVGGGSTIAQPLIDIVIAGEGVGVDSMRFASSVEALETAEWRPGAAIAVDVPVLDSVAPQTVFAQLRRDFGFDDLPALPVQADNLETADFIPNLPTNRVSETPAITLLHGAVATEMRSSQFPDFNDTDWVAYADSSVVVLAEVADQHLYSLFTQYRNHWFESPVRSDFALLGPGRVRVNFSNPLQDMIIEGGTTIEVAGVAETFDATLPVTEVEVHLGNGWELATGTENWEIVWDVPLLTEDTRWGVGALATAEDDTRLETGVAWIYVTVSQLTIAIDLPADADEVTRGLPLAINGTAAPFLAGAPLDSVVVAVLDERLASPTLESWSVNWIVPADATALIDIIAWAYAGDDSVSQRIQVTAVDAGQ